LRGLTGGIDAFSRRVMMALRVSATAEPFCHTAHSVPTVKSLPEFSRQILRFGS
jgi:hypothetical protein